MKLKLKPEFENTVVTINNLKFDVTIINQSEFSFFYDNGFSHLFEVSEISETNESKPKKLVKKYKGIENG
jgi:hypothetical protein